MSSSKPKAIVYEFNPAVYPVKLWILDVLDNEFINSEFEGFSGERLDIAKSEEGFAMTYNKVLVRKSTQKYGILVVVPNKKILTVSHIAHEATHVARFMWDYMGETSTGAEADAYLVGWIAECIEKVKLDKQ